MTSFSKILYHGFSGKEEKLTAPVHLAFDESLASSYAHTRRVAKCEVKLPNALILDTEEKLKKIWDESGVGFRPEDLDEDEDWVASMSQLKDFTSFVKKKGYDGIVMAKTNDTMNVTFGDPLVIVFNVNDIKILSYESTDMPTFKQFLLEDISIVNDKIQITTQHYKAGSSKESISTYFKSHPYKTSIKGCDADIYSLLNYVSSDISTDILKSLKGRGPYKVDEKQYAHFMSQVKSAASMFIRNIKPDVIIYPKSSSSLLKQFVDEVSKTYPSAEVLSDSFIKVALNAENVEPLINTNHPDWVKFAEENPKAVKELKRSLKGQILKGSGELQFKNIYKPYAKFIKNFIELRDSYEVLEKVLDNNVLIIDDILSTGSTMAEMVRQVSELEPSKITCLTLFKYTTAPK